MIVVAVFALVVFTEDITVNGVGTLDHIWGVHTDQTSEEAHGHETTQVVVVDGWVESKCLCLDLHFRKVLWAELNDTAQVGGGSNSLDTVVWLEVRHLQVI